MEPTLFFSIEDVCKRYKIKQSTLYDWVRNKGFPKPLKLGRLSRWRLGEIETWEAGLPQEISPSPEARIAAVKGMKRKKQAASHKKVMATA